MEDRVITHGDMHINNLCYKGRLGKLIYHQFTLIDFSSIKRTYGAIGDPAQDVGKLVGSIWKEVALNITQNYGDKHIMEIWYSIVSEWQEALISSYMEAYTREKVGLQKKSTTCSSSVPLSGKSVESSTLNIMTVFRERVYFYKLCLYAQFFNDPGQELKAKQFLLYFLMRESGLLDQIIAVNLGGSDAELKVKDEQLQLERQSKYSSSTLDPFLVFNFLLTREAGNGYAKEVMGHGIYHPSSNMLHFH